MMAIPCAVCVHGEEHELIEVPIIGEYGLGDEQSKGLVDGEYGG
jgi:hypothetical protein